MLSTLMLLLSLASPDGPPDEFRGMVVDGRGGPVAGVEIFLAGARGGIQDPRPILARGVTDETGHFRFPRPGRDKFPASTNSMLWAYKPGVGLAAGLRTGDTPAYRVPFDPQPGQMVEVTGPDKTPLPGIRVVLRA